MDGIRGLYHINAVDCVTQWKVVASVQTISEAHLLPVTEQMLAQLPFEILGFHADNGSEYVNHRVAELLDKLRIEFTRSRPRRSNDNGLAETKNGAVVRKLFGYEHIPQRHAKRFNTFCLEYLNPFLNFHRPCLFTTDVADPNKPGRIKRVYRSKDAMTPPDKLASVPLAATFLREGVTFEELHALARACARAHRCAGRPGTQRSTQRAVPAGAAENGLNAALHSDRSRPRWTSPLPTPQGCGQPLADAWGCRTCPPLPGLEPTA